LTAVVRAVVVAPRHVGEAAFAVYLFALVS